MFFGALPASTLGRLDNFVAFIADCPLVTVVSAWEYVELVLLKATAADAFVLTFLVRALAFTTCEVMSRTFFGFCYQGRPLQ